MSGVAVFFGLVAAGLRASYRRANQKNRHVGYDREEIVINAADVPQFKPNWQNIPRADSD